MKIDLHPDDLLDRDARGTLDDAARARLDAHLAVCVACRFEREARRDFACESGEDADRLSGSIAGALLVLKSVPPPALPLLDAPAPVARVAAPRRRLRVGLLVAAAMMIVGAAAATTGAVRWMSQPPLPAPPSVDAPAAVAPVKAVAPVRGRAPAPVTAAPVDDAIEAPAAEPSVVQPDPAVSQLAPAVPALAAAAPVARSVVAVSPVVAARDPLAPTAAPPVDAPPSPVVEAPKVDAAPVPVPVRAASALFSDANEARRRGDVARAIELYRELDRLHPASPEARVGRATMGRMLLESGDARAALERFDAYLAPGAGTLSEEALLGRAESLARMGKVADERAAWQQLLRVYPSSPHAARARARLVVLDRT